MLGKLVKYDLKATARTMLPLYAAIVVLSIISGLFVYGNYNNPFFTLETTAQSERILVFLFVVSGLLLLALLIAMFLLTVVCIVSRFNENLLGDEGFLMFTLPADCTMLLLSKLLSALFWLLCAFLIGGLSMWITFVLPAVFSIHIGFAKVVETLSGLGQVLFRMPDLWFLLIQLAVGGFFFVVASILTAYTALMIAQLSVFQQHRIVVAVAAFFAINWLFSFLSTVLPLGSFFVTGVSISGLEATIWLLVLVYIIQSIVLFFGTKWLMQHRLSLS